MGLGDADRGLSQPHRLALGDVPVGRGGVVDPVGAVDLPGDGFNLGLDRERDVVERLEPGLALVEDGEDFPGDRLAALAALGPDVRERGPDAPPGGRAQNRVELFRRVRHESVEGHHDRQPELGQILHVGLEVHQPTGERGHVRRSEIFLLDAAMHLERSDRGDDHRGLRIQLAEPALDVEKLLRAEIRAETRFGHHDVTEGQSEPGGHQRIAPVGDVPERTTVDQCGPALERLDQVWNDGILEQERHRAGGLEVGGGDRLPIAGEPDNDAGEPSLEVLQIRRQAENGHHLAAGHDDEPLLTGRAAVQPAEADDDLAKGAVVHVDGPGPGDPAGVDPERVAVVDVVVEHGREEVVGRGNRVKIPGEMEIDLVHRHDLGVAAAGGAALDAEDRT